MADVEELKTAAKRLQLREAAVNAAKQSNEIDTKSGAPAQVRALVGAVDKPEDRLATLRRFFPDAFRDPVDPDNFLYTNPKSGLLTLYNPRGLDVGDVASVSREIAQGVGGTLGAVAGAASMPVTGPAGPLVGAGLGTMAGEELANLGARALGAEDTRTLEERGKNALVLGGAASTGQMLGGAGGAVGRGGTRRAFRGGEAGRQEVERSVEDLARFGTTPSVAQATQNQLLDGVESLVSRTPGGAGRIREVVKETSETIAESIERKAAQAGGRAGLDPEFTGRAIQSGVTDFVGNFKDRSGVLFDELRTSIPNDVVVPVRNTIDILDELAAPVPGAPKVGAVLRNPEAAKLAKAVRSDATVRSALQDTGILDQFGNPITRQIQLGQDGLPFGVLLDLRSAVGRKLADAGLVSDIPRAQLKRIYRELTADIQAAANQAGVSKSFNRANSFYSAGLKRIEDVLEPLVKNRSPEKVFEALERGGKSGATQIRAVMKSLKPEQQRIVSATVMRRLGKAVSGQQGAEGEAFSLSTFLTNWNRLDKTAKDALFRRPGLQGMAHDLDALARAAERAQESSKAFFNPSGTAAAGVGSFGIMVSAGSLVTGAITGQPGFLMFPAIMASGAMSANGAARLMTNPNFVRWLARSTRLEPNGMGAHIGRLSALATTSDPGTKEAIAEFVSAIGSVLPQEK
jgi:hypothetical protein